MRKFLVVSALALGSVFVGAGVGSTAPPSTGPGTGNHPYFPLVCDGGAFDHPTTGFVVQANGRSSAFPIGFFYPGDLSAGVPDLTQDPILGVVMYREFSDPDTGAVLLAQSRGTGNTLDKLLARDDIAVCKVPFPFPVDGFPNPVNITLYAKG